ncbi:hypothetical protein BJY04DRAFT_176518 [Aspergillus karnatakaensis]|uniref:uncharacterized protein n=1 Tax=Aspergillus karnatakaensis TaxID=1810916 RepID=UPI003CCD5F63
MRPACSLAPLLVGEVPLSTTQFRPLPPSLPERGHSAVDFSKLGAIIGLWLVTIEICPPTTSHHLSPLVAGGCRLTSPAGVQSQVEIMAACYRLFVFSGRLRSVQTSKSSTGGVNNPSFI